MNKQQSLTIFALLANIKTQIVAIEKLLDLNQDPVAGNPDILAMNMGKFHETYMRKQSICHYYLYEWPRDLATDSFEADESHPRRRLPNPLSFENNSVQFFVTHARPREMYRARQFKRKSVEKLSLKFREFGIKWPTLN